MKDYSLLVSQASDQSEYLVFDVVDQKPKTVVISVMSKNHDDILGYIKWFGRWRQYTFFPKPETVFNIGCLQEIQTVISQLNKLQRDNQRRTRIIKF